MKSNKLLFFLILCLGASCVKYSFRGALPSNLENLYIQDFEDQTNYPGLQQLFMQNLTEAFIIDNSLQIIEERDEADLILKGSLISVRKRPTSITPEEQVQEFQMVVTVRAECLNVELDKPLWSGNLSRYGVISGNALRDEIDSAVRESVDQIVDDMISKTIGAW